MKIQLPVQTAVLVLTTTLTATAQSLPVPPVPGSVSSSREVSSEAVVNYSVRIEWRKGRNSNQHVELLMTEGQASLDTSLSEIVKIDDNEIPITVSVKATLRDLNRDRARLDLFIGRSVPYVTNTYLQSGSSTRSSSYQMRSLGMGSSVVVTFGKPMVIQSDSSGEVVLLVKRVDP